jgi:hypothetical protein
MNASGSSSFSDRAAAGASNMVDSAKRLLGVEPQPRTWLDELEARCCGCCPALNWQQRLFGCLLCFLIGAVRVLLDRSDQWGVVC